MKRILLALLLCNFFSVGAQTIECSNSPQGIETEITGGWSYLHFSIPSGMQLDSIIAEFDRPGYAESEHDFILTYTEDSEVYNSDLDELAFNYQEENSSLYNHWIDLTPLSWSGQGVVAVLAPVKHGVIWNDVCFALSYNGSSIPCYLNQDGLVAHYPFNGNADDESGNELHGVVSGAQLVSDRYGSPSAAYSYNGSSQYISMPSGSNELDIVGDFSVSFYIKSTDDNGLLVSFGDNINPTNMGYLSGINGGNVGQGVFGASTATSPWASSNTIVNDDVWHHVVYTFQEGTMSFYIDGQFVNDVSDVPLQSSWNGNRVLGTRNDLFQSELNYEGILDDLTIYNRALPLCEITTMYKVAEAMNPCAINYSQGDLDCNGAVDTADLLAFLSNFGLEIN